MEGEIWLKHQRGILTTFLLILRNIISSFPYIYICMIFICVLFLKASQAWRWEFSLIRGNDTGGGRTGPHFSRE